MKFYATIPSSKQFLLLIAIIVLVGCKQETKRSSEVKESVAVEIPNADIISLESDYITKINSIKENGSEQEVRFAKKVLSTISQFKDKHADTTILFVTNIDGIEPQDTVVNQISVNNDTVYVHSFWSRNGIQLWEFDLVNPYLSVSESEEFAYDTRNVWITFTIAVEYAIPTVYNKADYEHISDFAYEVGKSELLSNDIDTTGLKEYISDFGGQIFEYGEPELREGMFFWHEPSKLFLTYYHP